MLVTVLFLITWHARVTGEVSFAAVGALVLFVAMCLAYGSICSRLLSSLFASSAGVAFQLLLGYFVFNTLLFILALCSPLGMVADLAILAAIAVLALLVIGKQSAFAVQTGNDMESDRWAAAVAILIACIGATIWCGDAQAPQEILNGNVIFKVWPDTFIHAREISVFAQAHGIGTVQDIKLAGGRAPIYHFASYLSPAAISVLSGASAMNVYSSFQLPFGILLTGLAAYCLMSKLFGCWPGVVAVVAIVLFPDAFQQGFQNRYLSYNFMAQINLGLLYGIACAATAWMFMLDGCRLGKIGPVLLAYCFLLVCLFYKAHVFVANSYLLMIFPFIFFGPVRLHWRIVFGIVATVVFCMVVTWSQSNPRVPVLRLDGSGIGRYILTLLGYYDMGWMKQTVRQIFVIEKHSLVVQAIMAAIMLMISTFGVWVIGLMLALGKAHKVVPAVFCWFPLLIVGNYLVMTMGLAEDTRNVGTPDELINRPLVWAYFIVAAWTAAAGYRILFGTTMPKGKVAVGALAATVLCTFATLNVAGNLQTLPQLPGHANFVQSGSVPVCLVQAADYLRLSSPQSDIIQDLRADPRFVLTALSERQLYVGDTAFGGQTTVHHQRLLEMAQVAEITDQNKLNDYFTSHAINWVIAYPDTYLAWPAKFLNPPAFSCGGFRVFHFTRGTISMPPTTATVASAHKG